MTRPGVFLLRMLVFLAAVAAVAGLLSPVLIAAFRNNPGINSLILLVLVLGIAWNLHQVTRLNPEVTWVETFQKARPRLAALPPAPPAGTDGQHAGGAQCRRRDGGGRDGLAGSPCRPARCAACWTASPRGSTKAASCRAT